jgi:NADH-quinone oxidoreductase subunit C
VTTSETITDIEQLRERPAVASLLGQPVELLREARFERGELTLTAPAHLWREAAQRLREAGGCNALLDLTCVDYYPAEPRFAVVASLLSHERRERVRLKTWLDSLRPALDSLTPLWPGAESFEREVYDLFGVRFQGNHNMTRILLPADWEGHPLRKDYPVEGER